MPTVGSAQEAQGFTVQSGLKCLMYGHYAFNTDNWGLHQGKEVEIAVKGPALCCERCVGHTKFGVVRGQLVRLHFD